MHVKFIKENYNNDAYKNLLLYKEQLKNSLNQFHNMPKMLSVILRNYRVEKCLKVLGILQNDTVCLYHIYTTVAMKPYLEINI